MLIIYLCRLIKFQVGGILALLCQTEIFRIVSKFEKTCATIHRGVKSLLDFEKHKKNVKRNKHLSSSSETNMARPSGITSNFFLVIFFFFLTIYPEFSSLYAL